MKRELFEHIVMSVCKSEEKTKQVMNIIYGTLKYVKCHNNHFYVDTHESCPYCPRIEDVTVGRFKRCEGKHFYNKELDACPYCEPSVVVSPTQSNKKQELIDSLDYLKKKEHKTEKDKESISIIQAILNGMK